MILSVEKMPIQCQLNEQILNIISGISATLNTIEVIKLEPTNHLLMELLGRSKL